MMNKLVNNWIIMLLLLIIPLILAVINIIPLLAFQVLHLGFLTYLSVSGKITY